MKRLKLLTPGPVEVPERVLRAQARRVVSHRSPEFRSLLVEVTEGLAGLAGASEALVLAGSGTTAVDAVAWSLVRPGERALVVSLGEFGGRLAETLRARGARVTVVEEPRPGPHLTARVEELIEREGFDVVAVVQNETSRGIVFRDLDRLARAASSAGARLVVDAVSAYPVEEIPFDSVYAAAACSHKALAAPPGVAIVLLSAEAVRDLERRGAPANTPPLLDLSRYHRFLVERRETPFTPPVTLLYAVREAVEMVREKGLTAFREEHRRRAGLLYDELPRHGLEPLPPPGYRSVTVTAFRLPEGVRAEAVVEAVRARGYVVAAGMGAEKSGVVRVGVMGDLALDDVKAAARAIVEAVTELRGRRQG